MEIDRLLQDGDEQNNDNGHTEPVTTIVPADVRESLVSPASQPLPTPGQGVTVGQSGSGTSQG